MPASCLNFMYRHYNQTLKPHDSVCTQTLPAIRSKGLFDNACYCSDVHQIENLSDEASRLEGYFSRQRGKKSCL